MSRQEIFVPDIGSDSADVIEILVKAGDSVSAEQALVVLESAKASMEIPSPQAGVVASVVVKMGQQVKEGDVLIELELAAQNQTAPVAETAAEAPAAVASASTVDTIKEALQDVSAVLSPPATGASTVQVLSVPDIGSDSADVIEILVQVGQTITKEQSIIVLESAKASMEVPAAAAGVVKTILLKLGDKVSESTAILELEVAGAAAVAAPVVEKEASAERATAPQAPAPSVQRPAEKVTAVPTNVPMPIEDNADIHAGPAVRRLARELGVSLKDIKGSGPKARILKEDVHAYIKQALTAPKVATGTMTTTALPVIDFAKWGEIERISLTKIQKVSAQNLHRAWITIPHVTQFDEADITELEAFRVSQKEAIKKEGLSLTVLSFLVKASAHVLKQYPKFASSLENDGETLVQKKYIHIGVAVDTPNGLVVPVIRDADKKSIRDIAKDLGELSAKARDKKLTPAEMQGAVFSISSLGGIGGTAFTPIVNWPEVAILGVSRADTKPVWDGKAFQPRLMLPLSLSYDHRVIDGADAARFTTALARVLKDIRQLLL